MVRFGRPSHVLTMLTNNGGMDFASEQMPVTVIQKVLVLRIVAVIILSHLVDAIMTLYTPDYGTYLLSGSIALFCLKLLIFQISHGNLFPLLHPHLCHHYLKHHQNYFLHGYFSGLQKLVSLSQLHFHLHHHLSGLM